MSQAALSPQISFVFKRIEKKYLLDDETAGRFLEMIKQYICPDSFGESTICNVYYDTDNFELIRHSIEKPVFKEKLRLRSYGVPKKDSFVFLEIKRKYKGIVYKRRIKIPLEQAEEYLNNGVHPLLNGQVLSEIDYFISHYNLVPKLFLAYDRMAYYSVEDENLRLTFDRSIRSRTDRLSLSDGDDGETLLGEGYCLMEIKAPDAMPLWLVNALSELKIYPTSFSKYGNIYKKSMT